MSERAKREYALGSRPAQPLRARAKPAYPRVLGVGLMAAATIACGGTVSGGAEDGPSGIDGVPYQPGTGGMLAGVAPLPYAGGVGVVPVEETGGTEPLAGDLAPAFNGGAGGTTPGPAGAGEAPYEETGGTPGAGGTSGDMAPAFTGGRENVGGAGGDYPYPVGAGAGPYEEGGAGAGPGAGGAGAGPGAGGTGAGPNENAGGSAGEPMLAGTAPEPYGGAGGASFGG